jgi:hypothetical protein
MFFYSIFDLSILTIFFYCLFRSKICSSPKNTIKDLKVNENEHRSSADRSKQTCSPSNSDVKKKAIMKLLLTKNSSIESEPVANENKENLPKPPSPASSNSTNSSCNILTLD